MNRVLSSLAAVTVLCSIHAACAVDPTPSPRGESEPAAARPAPNDGRQATSLLGRPLFQPVLSDARRGQLEASLDIAKRAYDTGGGNEVAAIDYGRQLGYLGRFREAIDVYTRALSDHPQSYRLLRHRGHRYITCRELDRAQADLTRAWELAKDQPDMLESDGDLRPGVTNDPRSTDKSNILYHLGLAHYFKGDFERAAEVFGSYPRLAGNGIKLNDDIIVSFVNWQHLSLRQLGREKDAVAVLKACRPRMDVRENQAYHALLRVYMGAVPADVLVNTTQTSLSTNLAIGYGIAAYKMLNGDRAGSQAMFEKLAAHDLWPSFGVLAAEAELARQQNPTPGLIPSTPPSVNADR